MPTPTIDTIDLFDPEIHDSHPFQGFNLILIKQFKKSSNAYLIKLSQIILIIFFVK